MNAWLGISVLALPLIAALSGWGACRWVCGRRIAIAISACVALAALLALILLIMVIDAPFHQSIVLAPWIELDKSSIDWAIRLNPLSIMMMALVTFISALVHVYAIGYMANDRGLARFFAYLSLFTFSMLVLVSADNLVLLFLGWEGVGLCSYLLIGFWYEKPSANSAAIKAFVVNRIGDSAFVLGLCALFASYGTLQIDDLFRAVQADPGADTLLFAQPVSTVLLASLLIFFGAMGKSAQIGLHVWLPDAMEGPTPVSALIHAATMVTAGVFVVALLSPLYALAPSVRDIILLVGGASAFFAAAAAMAQSDIKRAIAWSTCSQLGYMFVALGLSAWGAAMFHLMTHAFFKGLLFLGAGAVIHALDGEQRMEKMGGLWRVLPYSCVLMAIGAAALAGVPFLSGYYSKDLIMEIAWGEGTPASKAAFFLAFAALFLTAFYSARVIFMTFFARRNQSGKVHAENAVMWVPMVVLAFGALFGGMIGYSIFVGDAQHRFWNGALEYTLFQRALDAADSTPLIWMQVAIWAAIALAVLLYLRPVRFLEEIGKTMPARSILSRCGTVLWGFLGDGWRFDALYTMVVTRPLYAMALWLARFFESGVIDRFGPDGMARVITATGRQTAFLHSGYLYHYAMVMIIGIVFLLFWGNLHFGFG